MTTHEPTPTRPGPTMPEPGISSKARWSADHLAGLLATVNPDHETSTLRLTSTDVANLESLCGLLRSLRDLDVLAAEDHALRENLDAAKRVIDREHAHVVQIAADRDALRAYARALEREVYALADTMPGYRAPAALRELRATYGISDAMLRDAPGPRPGGAETGGQ